MKKVSLLVATFWGLAVSAWAGQPEYARSGGDPNPTPPSPSVATCSYGVARAELDINNVRTLLFDGGDMWWDLICCPRYEIPKVDDPGSIKRHSMYAASIWVSGKELGTNNIYLMSQTYRTSNNFSFWPGPIDAVTAFTTKERCQVWDKMFKINRTEVADFEARFAAGLVRTTDDIPSSVLRWPGRGNPYLPTIRGFEGIDMSYDLARFIDRDGNGIYDPLAGDSPRLPGREAESSGADQCIFWVMNDVGNQKRFGGTTTNNRPIGMEIQTEAFAYATSDYTNDMTFYRQKLINKGTTILSDCYFGQWADPDLGFSSDDYVQFNVPRGLAICYNGDDFDEGVQGYGSNPPSIAIDFFKGPMADPNDGIDNDRDGIIDEAGELIIASNFVYYNNASDPKVGDPTVAQDYFNFMRSIWKDNSPMTYDLKNGTAALGTNVQGVGPAPKCVFIFPGASDNVGWGNGGSPTNPKPLAAWTEVVAGNPPGDRRMLTNAGAFTLRPGAINELTIGVVWARTTTGGATGSFNKLLAADDAAQKLFDNDFKILDGPDAPDVEITETDQKLLFTIIPHTSRTSTGQLRNTETYQERDFNSRLTDPFYRFEGYLVYQLLDGSVGFGDLDNPDKAKLVANVSSDVKNGVGTIINEEFSDDIGAFAQKVKVRGSDNGLIHTFALEQDLFSPGGGKLVNFKRYYFTVLAYGYNGDSAQQVKYIQGRQNRQKYAAMPHKVAPENGGTVLNSTFDQSIDVTRLQGVGNSGVNFDSLNAEDEAAIVANGSKQVLRYSNAKSPVRVRVYNPKKVVSGDIKLRLYSRVTYRGDISRYNVGDTIISRWGAIPNTNSLIKDPVLLQKPGQAVVRSKRTRLGGDADIVDLEVEMLNDAVGGRFNLVLNSVEGRGTNGRFTNYIFQKEAFYKKADASVQDSCVDFAVADFWRMYNASDNDKFLDSSARPVSILQDQISPKYGILISVANVLNPGEYIFTHLVNGYQPGSMLYGNRSKQWIVPIPSAAFDDTSRLNWWRNDDNSIFNPDRLSSPGVIEVAGALRRILDGSFASYGYVRGYSSDNGSSGGAFPLGSTDAFVKASLAGIQNVDIVITSDKSKWTRCVVIQGDSVVNPAIGQVNPNFRFLKSRLSSVNADFQPTGAVSPYDGLPSTGMSYFPGYAVDLDRGIRLNMAFLESSISDPANGNNLKWEPTTGPLGGKSYVYVFSSQYDQAASLEFKLDSIARKVRTGPFQNTQYARFWSKCIWVGRVAASTKGGEYLSTPVRIRLRVDKSYRSYPDSGGANGVPTYSFTTNGLQPTTKDAAVAKDALSLIRVVPNPYYAYSSYEQSQVDNRVRITNLPTKCQISVYNLSGSLIRRFSVDNSTQGGSDPLTNQNYDLNKTTFLDWDLKTQTGLPIASGAYIIHINAYNLGEKTVKWFGIMRPTDLDAISN